MFATHSPDQTSRAESLNEKIKQHVKGNWQHNFYVDGQGQIISAESYAYQRKVFERLFSSLFQGRSLLVFNELTGFYPAMAYRSGCHSVTVSSPTTIACELISDVLAYLEVRASVIKATLLAFRDSEPYVDMQYAESHDFLLSIGQIWPLFGAAKENFDAVVEACAFFVTEGVVFDWTDAKWASPPPPTDYNVDAFCAALRKKFEFVMCYSDWLVVATGKLRLPTEEELRQAAYQEFIIRFRQAVCEVVPPGSTVLIVSKGDHELFELGDRTAWHFPQTDEGVYAGYYPPDSAAVIDHVEALRQKGGEYLIFPQPSVWWLEHYADFQRHLESHYHRLAFDASLGAIFSLTGLEKANSTPQALPQGQI